MLIHCMQDLIRAASRRLRNGEDWVYKTKLFNDMVEKLMRGGGGGGGGGDSIVLIGILLSNKRANHWFV